MEKSKDINDCSPNPRHERRRRSEDLKTQLGGLAYFVRKNSKSALVRGERLDELTQRADVLERRTAAFVGNTDGGSRKAECSPISKCNWITRGILAGTFAICAFGTLGYFWYHILYYG